MLKRLIRPPVLYVDHIEGRGVDLFEATCAGDLEGSWRNWRQAVTSRPLLLGSRFKNRAYSQAEGRADFFAVTRTRTKAGLSATGPPAQSGAYTVKKRTLLVYWW